MRLRKAPRPPEVYGWMELWSVGGAVGCQQCCVIQGLEGMGMCTCVQAPGAVVRAFFMKRGLHRAPELQQAAGYLAMQVVT